MAQLILKEAERVSIKVLVDNYTDLFLLESQGVMRRPPMPTSVAPVAEHGLSILIDVRAGNEEHRILMDAALSPMALLHNMDVYGVDVESIEGIILSHGHVDHFGGLMGFVEKAPKGKKLDLILHSDAFCSRRLNIPHLGPQKEMKSLDQIALTNDG